jgi:hypothetical protein
MVPGRAGADTRVDVVISLAELLDLPGAGRLTQAWLAALAGEHAHLAGKGAQAAACDAVITPVVTGHPRLAIVDQMIDIIVACLDPAQDTPAGTLSWAALSQEARQAVRYAIARLAVDLVSGPGGLAATLRQGLLPSPCNTKPVILDVGHSSQIPGAIRRAVALRARHCEWPGCRKRPAACDVHHLRHKRDGGDTSVRNCVMLCQFHHDICIHRWGWQLTLHPDGTTTAYGPRGQVIHSHAPPGDTSTAPGHPPPGQPRRARRSRDDSPQA